MAIDYIGAEALLTLSQQQQPISRFLMLGRQNLSLTSEDWRGISSKFPQLKNEASSDYCEDGIFADRFLRQLGCEQIESLDFSDYEGCSLTHDLNKPIPESWHSQYDVVFDGGTLEHVFNFPNAIANAMNLVAEGGCFVSCTTSNNYNGHGFYQFSPELFFRVFAEENGFKIRLLALAETTGRREFYNVEDPQKVGSRVTFRGRGPLIMVVIAERVRLKRVFEDTPMQSDYKVVWDDKSEPPQGKTAESDLLGFVQFSRRIVKQLVPFFALRRFQRFRHERRQLMESRDGVKKVESLRECFDASQ